MIAKCLHCLLATMLVACTAQAADMVKLIVPTPPGGGTDGFFRVLVKEAEPALGEPIVVHSWRGSRRGVRALELCSSLTVCAVPSIPTILPTIGGVLWRRSSTYPTKDNSSCCSLLMLCVPTKMVGS